MENKKLYTCCFTGHRPSKLPWRYNERGIKFILYKIRLKQSIKKAIKDGYKYFITGMAMGSDIICAEIVIKIKKKYPSIKLECAIPCINQTEKWPHKSIMRYNNILTKADKITYVSSLKYFNGCMAKRNIYMINNSSLLIAVYNGSFGGTKQTIDKAKEKQINIKIIKP